MEVLIFVFFAIVVIGAIVIGWYMAEKRRKELLAWAQSKGLRFSRVKTVHSTNAIPNSRSCDKATIDTPTTS